jgi:4a-hydroxytetrahydrobiopterin dehydratase
MTTLATEHCVACQKGAPHITPEEIELLLPQLPGWSLVDDEHGDRLERDYRFGNFMEALAFTKRLGRLAERAEHHPSILTEWGHVRVTWTTKKIKGLHRNDFIMAARTDRLFALQDSAARD